MVTEWTNWRNKPYST